MIRVSSLLILILCTVGSALAQQVPDTLFRPPLKKVAYAKGQGPVVLIDEAHFNFHTAVNRFRPFALLLERDGYQVKRGTSSFSETSLSQAKVLVISNALNERNQGDWSLPNPPAFAEAEIETVRKWVEAGGSLFLIADHMPFPGCNEKLAAAFGFTFYNGFAMKKRGDGPDLFCLGNARLTQSEFTAELDSIYSFTGQAFDIPNEARPLLTLDDQFEILLPQVAWEFNKDTPRVGGKGKAQGAYRQYGKGKVIVFGEAAMFTAQLAGRSEMGFNHKKARNNAAFLLRLIHWLDNGR